NFILSPFHFNDTSHRSLILHLYTTNKIIVSLEIIYTITLDLSHSSYAYIDFILRNCINFFISVRVSKNEGSYIIMIHLKTDVEGERMTFGEAEAYLKQFCFYIGGNWDYDRGMFDGILDRESGETIYLRMPFIVIEGELDNRDALIEFQKPFIIKHVVNLG